MRSKLIITGAIGLMAAATLTVNAQSAAHRAASMHRTVPTLALALRTTSDETEASASPEATSTPEPSETPKPEVKPTSKPDVDARPAATAACTTAIANLKAMHQADVTEDASERAAATSESFTTASAADRSEDMSEAQSWINALKAAHGACSPQPLTTTCQSAITGLQAVIAGLRQQELTEQQGLEPDFVTDFGAVRTAFSAIQMACPDRE